MILRESGSTIGAAMEATRELACILRTGVPMSLLA